MNQGTASTHAGSYGLATLSRLFTAGYSTWTVKLVEMPRHAGKRLPEEGRLRPEWVFLFCILQVSLFEPMHPDIGPMTETRGLEFDYVVPCGIDVGRRLRAVDFEVAVQQF